MEESEGHGREEDGRTYDAKPRQMASMGDRKSMMCSWSSEGRKIRVRGALGSLVTESILEIFGSWWGFFGGGSSWIIW